MNDYLKQIEAVIRAIVFHSSATYFWFGKLSQPFSPAIKRVMPLEAVRSCLLYYLQSQLYADFYCRGFVAPGEALAGDPPVMSMTPLVEILSAVNAGIGSWETDWEVCAVNEDGSVVRRGGLELQVRPEDCLVLPEGSLVSGKRLSLRMPKELLSISPGFYMALSDKELTLDNSETLVRLYWNITPEGAIRLVQSATTLLNQAHLPFKLKVLNDRARFTRCDAAVLYIRRGDYHAAAEILERIYPEVADGLKLGTPAFTKQLAFGVGLAEDPGSGESFGQSRCRLLADGIIRAHEQGKQLIDERLEVVADRFAEDGISLERPFLNPGSIDDFNFQPRPRRQPRFPRDTAKVSNPDLDSGTLLRTAEEIGRRLSQEAIWYRDCCNWLGASSAGHTSTSGYSGQTYAALGPELYSGTSGIALFLAELYAATGNTAARRTALGAIRQAFRYIDSVPPPTRLSLYTGWMGIAFVAARVGDVLGEEDFLDRAARVLHRSVNEHQGGRDFSLLSGYAGAIVAAVVLQHMLGDATLLDFAVRLGDELLQNADKSETGYSWELDANPDQRHLTGLSQGAAGVGYALLELFQATGDVKYRKAAEKAFQYERYWFDAETGNWPDLRGKSFRIKPNERTLSFIAHWCHGAPGIALSRLRAYEVLADKACESEAIAAVETTSKTIESSLISGIENFSLCHGLAGNAEVLLYGGRVLGQAALSARALEVAHAGIDAYAMRGLSWPLGASTGEAPGLMTGRAGIGYFYLRLHNPVAPSILLLQRGGLTAGRRDFPRHYKR